MAKAKGAPEKSFAPDWKSVGVGFVAGMITLALIIAAGGRLEGVDILGVKVAFPTPTGVSSTPSGEGDVLSLEDVPFWVFSYGFGSDFIPPQHFSALSVLNDREATKDYKLAFSMPSQGDAAAGISFTLADPIDLTDYSYLEMAAQFRNSQCDLFLKDSDSRGAFVTISDTTPASMRTDLIDGKWQFRIALSNFIQINMSDVKEIGCNAHRCEGECSFELSEIKFVKP